MANIRGTDRKSDWQARRAVKSAGIGISVLVVTLALVAGGWRLGQMFGGGETRAASDEEMAVVTVRPGDTLWKLAVSHGPIGVDPRLIVAEIRELNGLSSPDLQPGMVVLVPTTRG